MATSYYRLDIKDRKANRSKGARAIRRQGLIPGILYYSGEENVNISIEKSVLFHAMQSGQRIFEIEQKGESQYTMIKQLQYHPVTDEIIHVDLMRVRRSEKINISVPLILTGDSIGVKEGGVLSQSLTQIEISCYPTDVPEKIELNIEELELNSALSVSDLQIDIEDVDVVTDSSFNIVSITPPAAEEVEEVEEVLDGEEDIDDGSQDSSDEDKNEDSSSKDTHEKSE
ncbi:MAG: 50S ribosomal protein L25 [Candidatus Neomarinimicrobiota bacterium]